VILFNEDIFPAHIYPFASIIKNHPIVFLKDYTVAVRIDSSMTRHNSRIYYSSPTETWIKMFNTVYAEPKYENLRKQCVNFMTGDYNGLIQLKTSGSMKLLVKEIIILAKYRPVNVINAKFWLFSLGTILVPGKLLRVLVDWFKRNVLSKTLNGVTFEI
jgi:hypothetical protein